MSQSRTICQVMDYGGSTGGSFVPSLCALSRALAGRGDRFAVVAREVPNSTWPAELEAAGAEVRLVRSGEGVLRTLNELRPDVVHTHFVRFDLTALRYRHSRVFWHVHSYEPEQPLAQRARAFVKYRFLSGGVTALVPVSQATGEYCLSRGAPRNRVRVVANGVDTARFRPPTAHERTQARERFGIAPDDRVVLFFERVPYKGGSVRREALARHPD
jgi:glycosyltransferase involved in cell wall biosynthesis